MQKITHFSYHAGKRAKQRTAISKRKVAMLLDKKMYLSIGKTPGINKEYVLFYSPPDALCYIAVRNPLTGAVITVLPVSYQGCTGWVVTEEMCQRVTEMTLNSPMPELRGLLLMDHTKHDEIKQLLKDIQANKEAPEKEAKALRKKLKVEKMLAEQTVLQKPRFEIRLAYVGSDNRCCVKLIGRIPAEKYHCEFDQLLADPDFHSMVERMVVEKNIEVTRYFSLRIDIGKKDKLRSHLIEFF